MDPRHPNIAFAANTGALLAFIGLLFSAFLPIGTPKGWALTETILVILVPLFLAVSWWARREHTIPVVHEHGSAASQYEAMEDLRTMVSSLNTQSGVNTNTAAVIESIIGKQTTQDVSAVSDAIGTLSSGDIGKSSAEIAHGNLRQVPEATNPNFDSRGFQTEGIASIPLPKSTVEPVTEVPVMSDLPDMLDLDDLLGEDESEGSIPPLDLPELPDF